jgi:hypothetical protein
MGALAHPARANVRGGWICLPELLSADAAYVRSKMPPATLRVLDGLNAASRAPPDERVA